jgi:hypothetical protein
VTIPSTAVTGAAAQTRLAAFGLSESVLRQAVQLAFERADDCVSTHPLSFRGTTAWAEIISQLRLLLAEGGWTVDRPSNLELVAHPENRIAVGVAAGTSQTGIDDGLSPRTRTPKGSATETFVDRNQQLSFAVVDQDFAAVLGENPQRATWLLLHYYDATNNEIRIELSLPSEMRGAAVVSWEERLILEPLPWDGSPVEYDDEDEQVDVQVQRRAT